MRSDLRFVGGLHAGDAVHAGQVGELLQEFRGARGIPQEHTVGKVRALHAGPEMLVGDVHAQAVALQQLAHLDQFRRTLAAKKPVFIDKPLAGSLKDAVEIVRLAREHNIPIFSSSSLRYPPETFASKFAKIGDITSVYSIGPAEFEPHHPDFFWYGIHCVEALYTVLGPGCVSVQRTHSANTDVITGVWSDGRVGTMRGNRNTKGAYGLTVFGSNAVVSPELKVNYSPLLKEVVKFFQTRVAPVTPEETVEIMAFMEAADESKRRGGAPVSIADVMKANQPR